MPCEKFSRSPEKEGSRLVGGEGPGPQPPSVAGAEAYAHENMGLCAQGSGRAAAGGSEERRDLTEVKCENFAKSIFSVVSKDFLFRG